MQPQVSSESLQSNKEKISLSLLLNIPEDFLNYECVASYDGREIRYFFGKSMKDIMPIYMESIFSKVIIADNNSTQGNYDYMAIPDWGQSNSYVRPFVFGIETNIKIQFISKDKNNIFYVVGKGEGQAGVYFESALIQAGNDALNSSLGNLREKIQARKEQFIK
jgi:hypothetical protein